MSPNIFLIIVCRYPLAGDIPSGMNVGSTNPHGVWIASLLLVSGASGN